MELTSSGRARSVFVPTKALQPRNEFRALGGALALTVFAVGLTWVSFFDTQFGRPSAWTQIVAPLFLVLAVWALWGHVRRFMIGREKLPLFVYRLEPVPALGVGIHGRFRWGSWHEIPVGSKAILDTFDLPSKTGRRQKVVSLRFETPDGWERRITVAEVDLNFDWVGWAQHVLSDMPGLEVEEGLIVR